MFEIEGLRCAGYFGGVGVGVVVGGGGGSKKMVGGVLICCSYCPQQLALPVILDPLMSAACDRGAVVAERVADCTTSFFTLEKYASVGSVRRINAR